MAHEQLGPETHSGYLKTCQRIPSRFRWRRMSRDTLRYIRTCNVCKRVKSRKNVPYHPYHPTSNSNKPFGNASPDFTTNSFNNSHRDAVLVVIDKPTNPAILEDNQTAASLFHRAFKTHSPLKQLILDHNACRTEGFSKGFACQTDIKRGPTISTALRNQTDGQRENQTPDLSLQVCLGLKAVDWNGYLDGSASVYGRHVHITAGNEPLILLRGNATDATSNFHFPTSNDTSRNCTTVVGRASADAPVMGITLSMNGQYDVILIVVNKLTKLAIILQCTADINERQMTISQLKDIIQTRVSSQQIIPIVLDPSWTGKSWEGLCHESSIKRRPFIGLQADVEVKTSDLIEFLSALALAEGTLIHNFTEITPSILPHGHDTDTTSNFHSPSSDNAFGHLRFNHGRAIAERASVDVNVTETLDIVSYPRRRKVLSRPRTDDASSEATLWNDYQTLGNHGAYTRELETLGTSTNEHGDNLQKGLWSISVNVEETSKRVLEASLTGNEFCDESEAPKLGDIRVWSRLADAQTRFKTRRDCLSNSLFFIQILRQGYRDEQTQVLESDEYGDKPLILRDNSLEVTQFIMMRTPASFRMHLVLNIVRLESYLAPSSRELEEQQNKQLIGNKST